MKFFLEDKILALISDASIDFTPDDFDAPLSEAQQLYLKKVSGLDISEVFWRKQIHGDDILTVEGKRVSARGCCDADAYITQQKNLPIAIRTADCVPVFIYDPRQYAIGLAHAGWKGTQKKIAAKTAQRMRDKFSCFYSDMKIVLGPCIRSCCYQVGQEFKEHFPLDIVERDGSLYVDMINANRRQLLDVGIKQENILDSGICTCCSQDYFSFRRDGAKSGRMISLMVLL